MKGKIITLLLNGVLLMSSCTEKPLPTYQSKDSTVYFNGTVQEYSLKGMSGDVLELTIPLSYAGPVCDYDREVDIEVVDTTANTAVLMQDFRIAQAVVSAGELSGKLVLEVNSLSAEVGKLNVFLRIVPNEWFPRKTYQKNISNILWTADYARPKEETVWKSWFYFLSPSYSKAYHKLLVEYFGTDIEKTSYESKALRDENLIYKSLNWWYTASRDFYQMVKEHDEAYPDDPYMHSADYEKYSQYTTAVGDGQGQDTPPTILSTLIVN